MSTEMEFIGFVVGIDGLKVDPKNVEVVVQWVFNSFFYYYVPVRTMFLFVLHGKRFREVPCGCKYLLFTCIN
jgi:hypothetical protein